MTLKKKPNQTGFMGHVIAHEPSTEATHRMVATMVEAGATLIEVQIPFSEPAADGPIFLAANHRALAKGVTYQSSLDLIRDLVKAYGDRCDFLVMTYLNIPYQRGYQVFAKELRAVGVIGTIVPDLPLESSQTFEAALSAEGLFNVRLVAPHGDWARTERILKGARELVYVVARKGVTGSASAFGEDLQQMLARIRTLTGCPLAVGFGVKSGADVRQLAGYADYVVVGTASLEAWMGGGEAAFRKLWQDLAPVKVLK